jgi:hypothetical protein
MSLSSVQLFSGRKRESGVWGHFSYNANNRKSQCNVVDETTKKPCGMCIAGKNPTNLKAHLYRRHEKVLDEIKRWEAEKKNEKQKKAAKEGRSCYSCRL